MWRFVKAVVELIRTAPARRRATDAELTERRYGQTNGRALFLSDPHREAMQEADQQWRDDPEAGLPKLIALAELGSIPAMTLAGWAYHAGKGVAADPVKAEYWHWRAIEGGSQPSQLQLGWIYTQTRNYPRCEEVYKAGVAQNWGPAMFYLGRIMLRQRLTKTRLNEARSLLERASALEDLGAQAMLAAFSARGRFGLRYIPRGFRQLCTSSRKLVDWKMKSRQLSAQKFLRQRWAATKATFAGFDRSSSRCDRHCPYWTNSMSA